MRTLVLPRTILDQIRLIVGETRGDCETGVALFGTRISRIISRASYAADAWPTLIRHHHVVLAVAGPGPRATHQPAHYSADTDYASGIYQALQSALPAIEWLGELHVHPRGMTWLSGGDRRTVKDLLGSTATDTVSPEEFIAGVMQRRKHGVAIYPYYFSRRLLEGCEIGIEYIPADADLVREARRVAAESRRVLLPEDAHPDGCRNDEHQTSQGWLATVVNRVRRKTHDERTQRRKHDG
jgi:hypothetical protein